MVRTRCLVGGGQRLNCHKGELEHCLAIGRRDFSQLGLGGVDGARDMRVGQSVQLGAFTVPENLPTLHCVQLRFVLTVPSVSMCVPAAHEA